MATVVITFFLFARFYVCKMDADCKEKRREWGLQPLNIVERRNSYSMDPQRFDEILAEITTGYNNIRSSFENVNIAEILEEVVTDYARAALEAAAPPKFVELAVLLQHCAVLYGRKVDYLYQQVLEVSEALAAAQTSTPNTPDGEEQASTPSARRRRRASGGGAAEFTHITVSACASAARAREPPRPPPTLPRMYIELEPRVPAPHDQPLRDDAGEPIGLPADYHVASRLHDGYLVDELEEVSGARSGALRPLSLLELQEALVAAAPPDPPPLPAELLSPAPPTPPPPSPAPPTPDMLAPPTPDVLTPSTPDMLAPPVALAHRKRKSSIKLADIVDSPLKAFITKGFVRFASRKREFSPPEGWVSPVVARRARTLLDARRDLNVLHKGDFRGFEDEHPDAGGFTGWSGAEAAVARATAEGATLRASDLESDDDGFFEGSSFSSFDSSRSTPPPALPTPTPAPQLPAPAPAPPTGAEGEAAWSARVAAAAVAEEARGGVDVRALGRTVLRTLPDRGAMHFKDILRRAATTHKDVSRLLLATLFLANSGNVEISAHAPLAVGEFSVSLMSADERLYAAAAAAEAALHGPVPTHPPHPPA